ncbi:hypothetical protein [Flavobacterium sp. WC2509]|uniref:hypothetical protein n=1 Tax=Flavobacterium sp. WC2509 TaxID=3461406 RepID=UPI004044CB33
MKNILLLKNTSFLFFNTILRKGFFIVLIFVLFETKANTSIRFNEIFILANPTETENVKVIEDNYYTTNQITLPLFNLTQIIDFASSHLNNSEMTMLLTFSIYKIALN